METEHSDWCARESNTWTKRGNWRLSEKGPNYQSQQESYPKKFNMSIHIKDSNDLNTRLEEAGDKLIVISFMSTQSRPSNMIEPKLEELATEMADSIGVLKVDVEECKDIVAEYYINSTPTFVFVKFSKKLEEFSGASIEKLQTTVFKYK